MMWEKKDGADGFANADDVHDVDNRYTWSSTGFLPDGTAFTLFLGTLNNCVDDGTSVTGGLGGHCDWRLPTLNELGLTEDFSPFTCFESWPPW